MQVLVLNEDGDPSTALNSVLSPALKPKKVTYQGLHQCESMIVKPLKPHTSSPFPNIPNVKNYPPTIRNPVDHVNATVGRLLVFKVPKVTTSLMLLLPFGGVIIVQSLSSRCNKTIMFLSTFLFRSLGFVLHLQRNEKSNGILLYYSIIVLVSSHDQCELCVQWILLSSLIVNQTSWWLASGKFQIQFSVQRQAI